MVTAMARLAVTAARRQQLVRHLFLLGREYRVERFLHCELLVQSRSGGCVLLLLALEAIDGRRSPAFRALRHVCTPILVLLISRGCLLAQRIRKRIPL